MHRLIQPTTESAEEDYRVLLGSVSGTVRAVVLALWYLDMPFCLLVLDQGADALHEVGRVLVLVAHDAHTLGGVVRAHIVPDGVEIALDEIGGVSARRGAR